MSAVDENYSPALEGKHTPIPTPWGWAVTVESAPGIARVFTFTGPRGDETGEILGFTYSMGEAGGCYWYTLFRNGAPTVNQSSKAIAAVSLMRRHYEKP